VAADPVRTHVAEFCADLRQLLEDSGKDEAGLRRHVAVGRSQTNAILNGNIRRPPDWTAFVGPVVRFCTDDDGRALTRWRRRHDVLVQVDEQVRRQERLAGRAALLAAPREVIAAVRPPRTLPAGPPSFVGRDADLHNIASAVAASRRAVCICAIEGMPGVGKTALALQAAHQASRRYGAGQLFVDLQGHTADLDPLTPHQALAALLGMLGVPEQAIPGDPDACAALYRNRLAGTRTLILLDNAATTDQVKPLLPGTAGCLVIVTSRHNLPGLNGTLAVQLDGLPESEAATMFCAIAGPDRTEPDDPLLPELVAYCGYLPLAISIVAARVNRRKALRTADIAEELQDEHGRLARVRDGDRNLEPIFGSSYSHLPGPEQRLFRLLGLHPGADFSVAAAANLIETSLPETRELLESLVDSNLLTQQVPRRYRFHDLIREYARTRAFAEDGPARAAARQPGRFTPGTAPLGHLLDFYLFSAVAADRHFDRRLPRSYEPAVAVPVQPDAPFEGPEQARAWVSAELANLHAAARFAANSGFLRYAVAVPAALAQYLRDQGRWALGAELHGLAVEAARQSADREAEAAALVNLAVVRRLTAATDAAKVGLDQALSIYQELDRRRGQAGVLAEQAIVQRLTGNYDAAESALNRAIELYTELGDQHGQAGALAELGVVQQQRGSFLLASTTLAKALDYYRQLGNRPGEAGTLAYLGGVQINLNDFASARHTLAEALRLCRELGDRNGQANALLYLGAVYRERAERPMAKEALLAARALYRELGELRGEASAASYLGALHVLYEDYEAADECLTAGLQILRAVHDVGGVVETLIHLGGLKAATGMTQEAGMLYDEALGLARTISSGKDEADALRGLAFAYKADGKIDQAVDCIQSAIAVYECHKLADDAERARIDFWPAS
jgi:tetratricopeptide (TPR) repeat protein